MTPTERTQRYRANKATAMVNIQCSLPRETFEKIERWRHGMTVVPGRAAAIRALLERALKDCVVPES